MNIISPPAFGAFSKERYSAINDCVQLDIYSSTNLFLETIPRAVEYGVNGLNLTIDLESELRKADYAAGDFRVVTRLVRNNLGSLDGFKMVIQDISPNRLEVRVQPKLLTNSDIPNISQLAARNQELINWFGTSFFEYDKQSFLANLYLYNTSISRVGVFDYIQDKITVVDEPWSIIFKLSATLSTDVNIGDEIWFSQEIATPITEEVRIIPTGTGANLTKLRGPNFDINSENKTSKSTEYKDWDDLLGTTNQLQVSTALFSSSLVEGIDLNVNYQQFENFTYYGSAYERIKNFEYKVQLLEYYDGILNSLSTSLTGLVSSSVTSSAIFVSQSSGYQQKKEALIGTFDGFERYMYYQSSSYVTNSFGEFLDMAWPKTGSLTSYPYTSSLAKPYTLLPSTSSIVENWLEGLLSSASLYDQNNANAIIKLLPAHVRESGGNESAETYVQMIGHYFDIVRLYVSQMTNMYSRDESLTEGLAKELVYHVGESLGLDLDNGSSLTDLWAYTLGLDANGSYVSTGSFSSYANRLQTTAQDYSTEIWKRIVNNLPYLLRTKGTGRGVRALINCFGIPRTILRIREYGGPEPEFDTTSVANFDRFSYGLGVGVTQSFAGTSPPANDQNAPYGFYGAKYYGTATGGRSYLNTSWLSQSRTIELRISPNSASRNTRHVPIFEIPNQFAITLLRTGSVDRVYFIASQPSVGNWIGFYIEPTASIGNIYDGNWTNVSFTYDTTVTGFTGTGYLKRVQYDKVITASGSASFGATVSASLLGPYATPPTVNIPGTASNTNLNTSPYIGQVQEFRLWSSSLNEVTVDKHTLAPTSYMSNVTGAFAGNTSSYDDLLFRLSLGSDAKKINLYTTTSISSQHPNQTMQRSASFYNFMPDPYTSVVETVNLEWPDLGTNRQIGNKIRIDSLVEPVTQVRSDRKVEQSVADLYPTDSPRLGVFLSPTDEVNQDIAEQFGGISIDDYIGDPADINRTSYDQLEQLRAVYLKKYQTGSLTTWSGYNAQRYINLLRYYDNSLFKLIKSFVPEKADIQTGLVIESDMLFRNKFKTVTVETPENLAYETTINLPDTSTIGGAIEDMVGERRNQPGYVFESAIGIPDLVEIAGTNTKQYQASIDGGVYVEFDNSPQTVKTFTTNESLDMAVTSYGGNMRQYGSQYRFFTTALSGSTYITIDALPEAYWNPLGLVITGSRQSANYTAYNITSSGTPAELQDYHVGEFASVGMKNARYDGSKLTSAGYNIDSPDTVDGGPVVTILQSNPNDLTVQPVAINKNVVQQSTKGGTFQIS